MMLLDADVTVVIVIESTDQSIVHKDALMNIFCAMFMPINECNQS
jgi:hypothetical protein